MDTASGFPYALFAIWMSLSVPAFAGNGRPSGVVVVEVESGSAAARAGLLPGDLLLSWKRSSPASATTEARGRFRSAFDLTGVEIEQAPRGPLEIAGSRNGAGFTEVMPAGEWKLTVRPRLREDELERYREGRDLLASSDSERGFELLRDLAIRFRKAGDRPTASWLWYSIGGLRADRRHWQAAEAAFENAIAEAAASGDEAAAAVIHEALAKVFDRQQRWQEAAASLRRALAIRRRLAPEGLAVAQTLNSLGIVARRTGDPTLAESYLERALAIRSDRAPGSLAVAASLNNLGLLAGDRGDLAAGESYYRRSLRLKEELAPGDPTLIGTYANLGSIYRRRGDLVASEECFRSALEIYETLGRRDVRGAYVLNNLASTAYDRGDWPAAAAYYQRALALLEEAAPQADSLILPVVTNLGVLAAEQGRLDEAEAYFERSLGAGDNPVALAGLGLVARKRGEPDAAEAYHSRALTLLQDRAPRSLRAARNLAELGRLAADRGDFATAEERYRRALAIRERQAPGSAAEAESLYDLAGLYRRTGRPDQASAFYDRALASLESQNLRLGGSDEIRAEFTARHAPYYRDALDLLVELGRPAQAFHVLEKYRARSLLRLLGERDLVFRADLPPELDRQRRMANANYDRIFRQLVIAEDGDRSDELRERLLQARRRQEEVAARIRVRSPRLAALAYPQPLDLAASHAALDAGTLMLSYVVGDEGSFLFAGGPGAGELRVFPLAVGEATLADEVERFREALSQGRLDRRPDKVLLYGRRLSGRLLAPAAAQIARAERLLILPDGPLHLLPFAALADPAATSRKRFLVEAKAAHVAASATVFALLKRQRRSTPVARLAAFGDPRYPTAELAEPPAAAPPRLRAALDGGFGLSPLPASRAEVESLRRLYPHSPHVYLGSGATEERAKAIGGDATLFHFACHGFLDDRSPLESALALSIPSSWRDGEENGLLQAWEIFEQVRIDADLVTLSACDTGLGKVYSGEGLLGLSRAFQYAGARSVLASLWSVGDRSTSELMERFYGYLKDGRSKADALRRAQIDLLRGAEFSHPFHWAGFELIGDWR